MKQKTYSDIKPEKKFSIENIENGKCTVLFFDNIQEDVQNISNLESEDITEKIVYSYDVYSIEITYRENLADKIENDIENWLKLVKEKDYNEVAADVRAKRNELLAETDKEMCLDRLGIEIPETISATNLLSVVTSVFTGIGKILNNNMAKYRQELRDLTEQEGFPYNVIWPTKDENKEE